ncbi:MAG: Fur family transcriptional regulator [Chloroflexota bacterium]
MSFDQHHSHPPIDPDAFQFELKDKLNSLGYRFTPQRKQIMDVFLLNDGHLTVKEVYDHLERDSAAIDQATVYRGLEFFSKLGVLHSSQIGGQNVFELTQAVPHHHLVCRNCEEVMALDDHHFDHLVEHLWEDHHFRAELSHVTISGLCANCAEA